MIKGLVRTVIPLSAFAVGVAMFPANWRKLAWVEKLPLHSDPEVVKSIEQTTLYQKLAQDPNYEVWAKNATMPSQHQKNQVSTGLMFGKDGFEIDPIGFMDKKNGKLVAYFHLGKNLTSADGQIHNGVMATILDEGLCMAGFPLLPLKRGVTAKLAIDFHNQAPPGSTVMLEANVVEVKGRKVVIEGGVSTVNLSSPDKPGVSIATASCILVEPKWFKYFNWLKLL